MLQWVSGVTAVSDQGLLRPPLLEVAVVHDPANPTILVQTSHMPQGIYLRFCATEQKRNLGIFARAVLRLRLKNSTHSSPTFMRNGAITDTMVTCATSRFLLSESRNGMTSNVGPRPVEQVQASLQWAHPMPQQWSDRKEGLAKPSASCVTPPPRGLISPSRRSREPPCR